MRTFADLRTNLEVCAREVKNMANSASGQRLRIRDGRVEAPLLHEPLACLTTLYSDLNATNGSTLVARRAGM